MSRDNKIGNKIDYHPLIKKLGLNLTKEKISIVNAIENVFVHRDEELKIR